MEREKPINIYHYVDYRKFLNDMFEWKKQINPQYSHRVFSRMAGFKASNVLMLAAKGKRKVSRESMVKFAKGLELAPRQARYFEAMVLFGQEESPEAREEAFRKMNALRGRSRYKKITGEQYEQFRHWYAPVIQIMVDLPDFQAKASWIANRLRPQITSNEASEALHVLENLGYVKKDADGRLRQASPMLDTDATLASFLAVKFHTEMIKLGLTSLERFPAKQREVSSVTISISQKNFEEIRARIRDFQDELMELAEKDRFADVVYQVNFQLFPLVEPKA